MRRWLLFGSALLVATAGAGGNAWAAASAPATAKPHVVASHESFKPGTKQVVRFNPKLAGHALAPAVRPLVTPPATAKINVTYIGFSAPARAAFQAAVNIWQQNIHSSVPIDVVADWSNLSQQYNDPFILGAAGPTGFVSGVPGLPNQNAWYPLALANAITGSDLAPANVCNSDPSLPDASGAEITASFNSTPIAPWYYGTGTMQPGQVDLESVVLHELGHGLGFVGTFDGLDPSTGNDTGKGYFGLSGDGQNPTIFDTFASDSSGTALTSYVNGSTALGNVLRGGDNGAEWNGSNGVTANSGTKPLLFSPGPSFQAPDNVWEEGSSFSHLDENTYPAGSGNALMTPQLGPNEIEQSVGPIVLGMFHDMGWPQTGTAPAAATIGDYNVAAPFRLVSAHVTSNSAPLHIKVAGVDSLPSSGVKAAVVTVTVQSPTRNGIWSALPNCAGTSWPDSQNYQAKQTRTTQSVLPLDDNGNIEVSLVGSPNAPMNGVVSVDLVGWYGSSGVSYHPLAQKLAWSGTLTPTPVDLKILGVAGVPTRGVTAVAVSTGVGFMVTPGFALVGPGGVNTIAPTVGYNLGEFTQNLAVVPVGTGASAGKIRLKVNAGHASVSMYVVGWYGPSTTGGLNFHPAGPARVSPAPQTAAPKGQDVTIGGLPNSTPVLLNIHLASPTASGSLSAGPGGSSTLALVQEMKAGQSTSGRVIVTTNAAGQVRLRLSGGTASFYTDIEGWFSAS